MATVSFTAMTVSPSVSTHAEETKPNIDKQSALRSRVGDKLAAHPLSKHFPTTAAIDMDKSSGSEHVGIECLLLSIPDQDEACDAIFEEGILDDVF